MNSWGTIYRISIWGESHGPAIGIVVDGCPPGLNLKPDDFKEDLGRRRGGPVGTTSRHELDLPIIQSGLFRGKTTGAPLSIGFENSDTRSSDYDRLKRTPRPGHADWTAHDKFFGFNDYRGGGHLSGRLTLGLVAAGVIAKKIVEPIKIHSRVLRVGGEDDFQKALKEAVAGGDSIGGIVECRAGNVPSGLGEPFFDSVESLLAHAVYSIPGVKGVEFGDGFAAAGMRGSDYNDEIVDVSGRTKTNHAGGVLGGITNGNELVFRIAVRPAASIARPQQTIDLQTGKPVSLTIDGRHDACIALRVPVILEAVTALVLADLWLRSRSLRGGRPFARRPAIRVPEQKEE
jgi:chorismate synthase